MKQPSLEQIKNIDRASLERAYLAMSARVEEQSKIIDEMALEIELLKELNRLKSRLPFTPSTEQLSLLFDEAELLSQDEDEEQEKTRVASHQRAKHKKHDLTTLPADTPVTHVYHDAPEHTTCDRCETPLQQKADKVVYKVAVVPRSYMLEVHHFATFACNNCEADEGEQNLVTHWENKDTDTLIASTSLVADCAVRKYADALPLYRQEAIFKREGFNVSRQTISNWLLTYMNLLTPLRQQYKKYLFSAPLINQDETPVKVIHLPEPATSKSTCMFVQVGTSEHDGVMRHVVLFTYLRNKLNPTLESMSEGYQGYVMTDGLKGYLSIDKHLNCWVHASRGFKNIIKTNKKAQGALKFVNTINRLFRIERDARRLYQDKEQFLTERKKAAAEVFGDLKKLIDENRGVYSSKSPMGQAISYLDTYWASLTRYVDCYESDPGNNIAENAIRPYVVGRKNWLFSNTEVGADASSFYYSMIETAKLNGVNVADYMWYCLSEAPRCTTESDWENLLPWNMDADTITALKKRRASAIPDPARTEPYVLRGAR